MKKFLYIILLLFVTSGASFARGYDMNFPLPGESIANDRLQFEVVQDLYKEAAKKYPACLNFNVSNTQIVHYPHDVVKKKGKFVSGYWKEIWSVKACDNVYQVPLTFYIKKKTVKYAVEDGIGNYKL